VTIRVALSRVARYRSTRRETVICAGARQAAWSTVNNQPCWNGKFTWLCRHTPQYVAVAHKVWAQRAVPLARPMVGLRRMALSAGRRAVRSASRGRFQSGSIRCI